MVIRGRNSKDRQSGNQRPKFEGQTKWQSGAVIQRTDKVVIRGRNSKDRQSGNQRP